MFNQDILLKFIQGQAQKNQPQAPQMKEGGDAFSEKVRTLMHEGYPQKQALAIAYSYQKRGKLQHGGSMMFSSHNREGLPGGPNEMNSYSQGVITTSRGQWDYPGQITRIPSNRITMQDVPYPVLGVSDTGHTQLMHPEGEYRFDGNYVTEYPLFKAQDGLQTGRKINISDYNEYLKRKKAYQDSLDLYNVNQEINKYKFKQNKLLPANSEYHPLSAKEQKDWNETIQWNSGLYNPNDKSCPECEAYSKRAYLSKKTGINPIGQTPDWDLQFQYPTEVPVYYKGPKNAISFEPETTNLGGDKGQYVYYDTEGVRHVITQQEYDRRENQGTRHYNSSFAQGGEMIKRADGSYSRRGLWDNIRANRGSGKKPTKEMLKQEKKIRAQEKAFGGLLKAQLGLEQKLEAWLGHPMKKAFEDAAVNEPWFNPKTKRLEKQDPIDNVRHSMAGRYVAEAIANKTGNIPYLSNALGYLGSNAFGIAHELTDNKYTEPERYPNYSFSDALREAGEDIYNNAVGAGIGVSSLSPNEKSKLIRDLSFYNILPDGQAKVNMYRKANGGFLNKYPNVHPKLKPGGEKKQNKTIVLVESPELFDKSKQTPDYKNPFVQEAKDFQKYIKSTNPNEDVQVYPYYYNGNNPEQLYDYLKNSDENTRLAFFAHSGDKLFGMPTEWIGEILQETPYKNCYAGSCNFERYASLPQFKSLHDFHYRPGYQWFGVNPSPNNYSGEQGVDYAMYSTVRNEASENNYKKQIEAKTKEFEEKWKDKKYVSGTSTDDYVGDETPEYQQALKNFTKDITDIGHKLHLSASKINNPVMGVDYKILNPTKNQKKYGGWLNKYEEAGATKSNILTYASNPEYFDNHAVYSDNPQYNDLIRKSVYAGTHGFDPQTGALYKLDKPVNVPKNVQKLALQKGPTSEAELFKNNPELRKQYIEESTKKAYENPLMYAPGSIGLAALPETFGMAYGLGHAGAEALQGNYTQAGIEAGLSMLPFLPHTYEINPWANKINNTTSKIVGEGADSFIYDPDKPMYHRVYKTKPNFFTGYRKIKDPSNLDFSSIIEQTTEEFKNKALKQFKTLTGGKGEDIDLKQFVDYVKAEDERRYLKYLYSDFLTDINREKYYAMLDTPEWNKIWGDVRNQADVLFKDIEKTLEQKDTPLGKKLGSGAEGQVYELVGDPNNVIKIGQTIRTNNAEDLVKSFEGITDDNIARVTRAYQEGRYLNEIMPNLNANPKFSNFTREQVLDKLEKDARALMDRGFYLDVDNINDNFRYNPEKNKVDIFDISKPSPGVKLQDQDAVINILRHHFGDNFLRIDKFHPLYDPNMPAPEFKNGGWLNKYAEAGATVESSEAMPVPAPATSTPQYRFVSAPERTYYNGFHTWLQSRPGVGSSGVEHDKAKSLQYLIDYKKDHPTDLFNDPEKWIGDVQYSLNEVRANPGNYGATNRQGQIWDGTKWVTYNPLKVDGHIGDNTANLWNTFPGAIQVLKNQYGTSEKDYGQDYEAYQKDREATHNFDSRYASYVKKPEDAHNPTTTVGGWKWTYKSKYGGLHKAQWGEQTEDETVYPVNPIVEENKQFLKKLIDSPLFGERLKRQLGDPEMSDKKIQRVKDFRKSWIDYTPVRDIGQYNPEIQILLNGEVQSFEDWKAENKSKIAGIKDKSKIDQLYINDVKNQKGPGNKSGWFDENSAVYMNIPQDDYNYPYVNIHELSHASEVRPKFYESKTPFVAKHQGDFFKNMLEQRATNYPDASKREEYLKFVPKFVNDVDNYLKSEEFEKYVSEPTELKARVDGVRKAMFDAGLYDATKENFTPEHYEKMKQLWKNQGVIDIMNLFPKEEIIRMMNDIAYNKGNKSDMNMARYGGDTIKWEIIE